ncbi:YebC/PmpR family DNA-binding transcriptional regulator [Acidihalobacter prosperus]
MAGHSKWANIQHRKGAQDKKRGKLFTKLIREITVAARMGGGGDPATNPRLRLAVDKALGANMPKDTVERAIKRGTGELGGENYEEVRYEGYGPGGVAVMVDCMTDNRNRTVAEVRHAFTKAGGNLGTDGSVAFMFANTGVLSYPSDADEDRVMEAALEAGAEDVVVSDDGSMEVLAAPDSFEEVREAMRAAGLEPESAEVTQRASNGTPLDVETAEKLIRMLDTLEDLDDVQNVYSNAEFPDELLEQMAAD